MIDVNFNKIWDSYLRGNKDKINIYIHPKFPDKVTWKKKNIINNLKETAWGFIVSAYIELFREAYKDPDNYKFITISESCIPIQSFDIFYNDVMKDDRSLIKLMPINNYYKSKLDNHKVQPRPPFIIKHYARMCLNRKHVGQLLLSENKIMKTIVTKEYFIPKVLVHYNFTTTGTEAPFIPFDLSKLVISDAKLTETLK